MPAVALAMIPTSKEPESRLAREPRRGAKYWDTREFRQLEREWKDKLYRSGFDDIEPDPDGRFPLRYSRDHNVSMVHSLCRVDGAALADVDPVADLAGGRERLEQAWAWDSAARDALNWPE